MLRALIAAASIALACACASARAATPVQECVPPPPPAHLRDDPRGIVAGQTRAGVLEEGDIESMAGREDVYWFTACQGQEAVVTQTSSDFAPNPRLWISTHHGQDAVADVSADIMGPEKTVTLTYVLPYTGSYSIYAGSLSSETRGAYTLTLQLRKPATPPPPPHQH